jgi:hypothetical protein
MPDDHWLVTHTKSLGDLRELAGFVVGGIPEDGKSTGGSAETVILPLIDDSIRVGAVASRQSGRAGRTLVWSGNVGLLDVAVADVVRIGTRKAALAVRDEVARV